jgi:peptide/nickel transport system substrate-binding protein
MPQARFAMLTFFATTLYSAAFSVRNPLMPNLLILSLATLLALGFSPRPAAAAELKMALSVEPDSIDPHFHDFGGDHNFMNHIFEPLMALDVDSRPTPVLALSMAPISDTVWEVKLRPNVTFSDGTPFTAADVAFSIHRVPDVPHSPVSYAAFVKQITDVEIIDPLTLHLHTAKPFALMREYLSEIGIISAAHGATAASSDYDSGTAAIGTGPYLLKGWLRGDRINLTRNPTYWGPHQPWDSVSIRYIRNPASRLAAILSGDVDIIDQVSVDDIDRVRSDPKLKVISGLSVDQMGYVFDDVEHEPPTITDNAGQKLAKNPLADVRVRRAFNLAINRDAIVARLMNGQAVIDEQYMTKGTFGYNPDIKPWPYDPAQAKKLLTDAGYPNGFKLTIGCQNDRFVKDAQICQAVAQMITRIGVEATPELMPHSVWVGRVNRREFSFFTYFNLNDSGEPSVALLSMLSTYDPPHGAGMFNRGRHSNPEFDAIVRQAMLTLDDPARDKLLQQAAHIAFVDDVALVPVLHELNIEAMTQKITHQPLPTGAVMAMDVQPAK